MAHLGGEGAAGPSTTSSFPQDCPQQKFTAALGTWEVKLPLPSQS